MSGGTTYVMLATALTVISGVGSYVAAVDMWYHATLVRMEQPSPEYLQYLANAQAEVRADTFPATPPDVPRVPTHPDSELNSDERSPDPNCPLLTPVVLPTNWATPPPNLFDPRLPRARA